MCILTVRAILIDGQLRLGNSVPCTTEYGQLTGLLVCSNTANWAITQRFTDESGTPYDVRANICRDHFDWCFTRKNLTCPEHGEPYQIVYP